MALWHSFGLVMLLLDLVWMGWWFVIGTIGRVVVSSVIGIEGSLYVVQ